MRLFWDGEIVEVTANSGGGNVNWTIVRGVESTTAISHADGSSLYQTLTSGGLLNYIQTNSSQVLIGTRANLPGSVPVAGTTYVCTDSPYEYVSTGSVWSAFFYGQPVTEPIPGNFSWMNQNTATLTTTFGGMQLFSPHTSGQVNIQYLAYPSTPFTRTMAFLPSNPVAATNNGMGFVFSDGTKIETFFLVMGTVVQLQVDTGATAAGGLTANLFNATYQGITSLVWLQYSDSGSNRTFKISLDSGSTWYQLYTEATNTFLTPTRLGFMIDAGGATYGAGNWVVHWA